MLPTSFRDPTSPVVSPSPAPLAELPRLERYLGEGVGRGRGGPDVGGGRAPSLYVLYVSSHSAVDHGFLLRRGTVTAANINTTNIWALILCSFIYCILYKVPWVFLSPSCSGGGVQRERYDATQSRSKTTTPLLELPLLERYLGGSGVRWRGGRGVQLGTKLPRNRKQSSLVYNPTRASR